MKRDWAALEKLLSELHEFPTTYVFKFIVPAEEQDEVARVFPETKTVSLERRASSGGRYCALTISMRVASGKEIIAYYKKLEKVKGLISL